VDPKNAATYAANAETAVAEVGRAEREAAAVLDRVGDKQVAVFHDAYGYFFAHFGLTEPLSLAEGDAADPGAARISEIRAALSEGTCVFPEAGHDPKLIAALAEGTGAKVAAALDPEGRGLETGAGLYAALIGGLATTIAGCAAAP
jgi:zinc transport system substrate-binding protein